MERSEQCTCRWLYFGGATEGIPMEDRFWEPVTDLEVLALDTDCIPMKNDPDEPQKYGCTVIGFNLDDPECCRSILTITGEDDRAEDEVFAKRIIFCLQNIGECPKCGSGPLYQDRVEARDDMAHCDACGADLTGDEYRAAVKEYEARAKEI
jgi:hypothetical protein